MLTMATWNSESYGSGESPEMANSVAGVCEIGESSDVAKSRAVEVRDVGESFDVVPPPIRSPPALPLVEVCGVGDGGAADVATGPDEGSAKASSKGPERLVSDVANGPWNQKGGPLDGLPNVQIMPRLVSIFDLREVLENVRPDLVVMFGTWRNVLTRDVLKEGQDGPTKQQQNEIAKVQYSMFDDGCDFLQTCHAAVLAQTQASVMSVRPTRYLWRTSIAPTPRPRLYCPVVEKFDHYQGSVKHDTYDMVYWAGNKGLEAVVGHDGVGSVVQVCSMHRKVLVVSAGRGEFWRQIILDVSKMPCRGEGENDSPQDGSGMVWGKIGAATLNNKFERYTHDCEICKGEARTCRRCLRYLKHRVADIPEKKWRVKTREAGIQTDAPAQTDAVVQTELSWARRMAMALKMLCGSTA